MDEFSNDYDVYRMRIGFGCLEKNYASNEANYVFHSSHTFLIHHNSKSLEHYSNNKSREWAH